MQASDQSLTSSSGELSVGSTPNCSVSLLSTSYPPSKSSEALIHSHLKRGSSQEIPGHSNHSNIMSRTDTEVREVKCVSEAEGLWTEEEGEGG